jgi:hypothetical protein
MSFFEKLDNIDRRILLWGVVICVTLPYFVRVGLPIPYEAWVLDAIDFMENEVPDGATVLYDMSAALRVITELEGGMSASAWYATQRGWKVVGTAFYPDGVFEWYNYIEPEFIKAGYVYGEDYVFLGYIPGESTGVDRLAKSIRGVITVDAEGNNIDDIPMMADIDTHEDFAFVLAFGSGWTPGAYITNWYLPYGSHIIPFSHMYGLSGYLSSWMAGFIPGTICGVRGSGEWANYLGLPSAAVTMLDSVGLGHAIMIFMMILGNISMLYTKYVAKDTETEGGSP